MTLLVLVRHGESIANTRDRVTDSLHGSPLTKNGAAQARFVADELAKMGVSRLYTSPLTRTRQTARIIGGVIGLKAKVDYRLRERKFGELADVPAEEWHNAILQDRLGRHTELWPELTERAGSFIDAVAGDGGTVVAVTHQGFIRGACGRLLGLDDVGAFIIRVPNCSMTMVHCSRAYKLLALGVPFIPKKIMDEISGSGRA